jgi:hypothetical protein
MSTSMKPPVLIIGGAGVVGSQAARLLRQLHPDLPITIGGRDLSKAATVARESGLAHVATIDLERADLGLPVGAAYSAIALFVKDDSLNSVRYAQALGVPYLSISTGVFEIGPEVALYIHRPASAPILMASHWLAGAATLPALHFAREFQRIDTIEIGAVLDDQDMGGPAAYADYERLTRAAPNALIRKRGKWLWATGEDATRRFRAVDGIEVEGRAYSAFDVVSLAAATDAASVRFDLVVGESASRRRGEAFSTEMSIEIAGQRHDGTTARVRHELIHPAGQGPVTAVGVAVGIERLLGLAGGPPAAPGLYLPEVLIEPEYMLRRLEESGTQIRRASVGEL